MPADTDHDVPPVRPRRRRPPRLPNDHDGHRWLAVEADPSRLPSCPESGKARHATFYGASLHLRNTARRKGRSVGDLDIYECPHCGDWHIGHNWHGKQKIRDAVLEMLEYVSPPRPPEPEPEPEPEPPPPNTLPCPCGGRRNPTARVCRVCRAREECAFLADQGWARVGFVDEKGGLWRSPEGVVRTVQGAVEYLKKQGRKGPGFAPDAAPYRPSAVCKGCGGGAPPGKRLCVTCRAARAVAWLAAQGWAEVPGRVPGDPRYNLFVDPADGSTHCLRFAVKTQAARTGSPDFLDKPGKL